MQIYNIPTLEKKPTPFVGEKVLYRVIISQKYAHPPIYSGFQLCSRSLCCIWRQMARIQSIYRHFSMQHGITQCK